MSPQDGPTTRAVVASVAHRTIDVDGIEIFYRESGPEGAPVVLLPHGYPCSSFAYRHLLAALGDSYRMIAPDLPGFGYSATPDRHDFSYTFAGYGGFLARFVAAMRLDRYSLYLHDYGSQVGFRLAMSAPHRITALIIQNGDIYEDQLGPKYDWLKGYWENPTPEGREQMVANISEEGFRDEFVSGLPAHRAERVSPDLWTLHWRLMNTPQRRANILALFEDQATTMADFPEQQAYLREHQPPTLIVWGPHDGYMPERSARAYLRDRSARAYLRDLPDAELHLLDGGHWLLETNLDEVVPLVHDFLVRAHA